MERIREFKPSTRIKATEDVDFFCTRCDILLTDTNWPSYWQNSVGDGGLDRRFICRECWARGNREGIKNRLQYDHLHEKQGGKCGSCGIGSKQTRGGLFVDHNHDTGMVRGLLCSRCNTYLGFYENQKMQKQLGRYLREHEDYSAHEPNGQVRLKLGRWVWVAEELDHKGEG